jgi:hypothetical protein
MSSPSRFVGSTTASFIARVTRPHGGAGSTLILFPLRSGSGSTRGSMAMTSPQAKASRRRKVFRSKTRQFKIELAQTTMRMSMRRAPLLKTASRMRASDLVLDLIDGGRGTTRSPGPEGIVLGIFLVFDLGERRSARRSSGLTRKSVKTFGAPAHTANPPHW